MEKLLTTLEAQHRGMENISQEIDAALAAGDGPLVAVRLGKLRAASEEWTLHPMFQALRS